MLAWVEQLPQLHQDPVQESDFLKIKSVFIEEELMSLTMAIIAINSWNRIGVRFIAPRQQ